jgi:hypothetical protein
MTEQYSLKVGSYGDVPAGTHTSIYCDRGIVKVDIRPFQRKGLAYPATRGVDKDNQSSERPWRYLGVFS